MSTQNIEKEVQKALKELTHLYTRVLPVKVGKEVVSSVRRNFREGGFYSQPWQRTKRQDVPFKGASGSYGPLLSKTNHLMSSTDYVPGDAQVTIRNTVPYAQYHNEGAQSTVTKKMKKFFWAKSCLMVGYLAHTAKPNGLITNYLSQKYRARYPHRKEDLAQSLIINEQTIRK